MTPRKPFGSDRGELASVDIVLALRRRERDAEEAARLVREKIARAKARRERMRAAFARLFSARVC